MGIYCGEEAERLVGRCKKKMETLYYKLEKDLNNLNISEEDIDTLLVELREDFAT